METTHHIMCVFYAVLMLAANDGTRHGVADDSLTHSEILQRARVPRLGYTFYTIEIFGYYVGLILESSSSGTLGAKHAAAERPAPSGEYPHYRATRSFSGAIREGVLQCID